MRRDAELSEGVLDSLLPDVNELSAEEVDELLGEESESLTRRYFEFVTEEICRPQRATESVFQDTLRDLPAHDAGVSVRALAEYIQSQLFVHFHDRGDLPRWNARAWQGTHIAARAMRRARDGGVSQAERSYLLDAVFDGLARIPVEYVSSGDAQFDDLWPLLECLEQLAMEAWTNDELAERYARRYASFLRSEESETLTCMLAWGVSELFERGTAATRLASRVAELLLENDPTDLTRCVLRIVAHVQPRCRPYLPVGLEESSCRGTRNFLTSFFSLVNTAKESIGRGMAEASNSTRMFESELPPQLSAELALTRSSVALPGLAAMAGGRVALQGLYEPLQHVTPAARRATVDYACRNVLRDVTRGIDGRSFLAFEALEGLRDHFPNDFAASMALAVRSAAPALRQGTFVCITEGYEERFKGRLQAQVPRFAHGGSEVHFIAGSRDSATELDAFGHEIARFAMRDPTIRVHMDWLNDRLSAWANTTAA